MEKKSPKTHSGRMMQNVKFDTVAEMLDSLPDDELKITLYLRQLIFECVPDVEEKISYNVPFYRRNAVMVFIWPGSVSWGTVQHAGVRFGFQYGHLLGDEIGYLDRGNRKQVYWKDFLSLESIDPDLVRAYLFAAVEVDDAKAKRRRK